MRPAGIEQRPSDDNLACDGSDLLNKHPLRRTWPKWCHHRGERKHPVLCRDGVLAAARRSLFARRDHMPAKCSDVGREAIKIKHFLIASSVNMRYMINYCVAGPLGRHYPRS